MIQPGQFIPVLKLDLAGQETWRYEAKVLQVAPNAVLLVAGFNRPAMLFHGILLGQGDQAHATVGLEGVKIDGVAAEGDLQALRVGRIGEDADGVVELGGAASFRRTPNRRAEHLRIAEQERHTDPVPTLRMEHDQKAQSQGDS